MKFRRFFIGIVLVFLLVSTTMLASCKKDNGFEDITKPNTGDVEEDKNEADKDDNQIQEDVQAPQEPDVEDDALIEDDTDKEKVEEIASTNLGLTEGLLKNGTGNVVTSGEFNFIEVSRLNEAAYFEFINIENADSFNVYIKGTNDTDYKLLYKEDFYVRQLTETTTRIDLFGLAKGDYDVKLIPVVDSTEMEGWKAICEINVVEYDRSGYAHFKYSDGVGAYNDDGTLKDDAIVIYVTEENKNTVMTDVCAEYDLDMFNIPNYFSNSWYNKEASGIGWWLNNSQYTMCVKNENGTLNAESSSNTYSPTGKDLGFRSISRPVVVRFIGTVTTPEGATSYNSSHEGGTVEENGHMVKMKNLKNVTLEGVGFDAIIEGWGFHFICDDTTGVYGKSFEVRNLTFKNYPEDAIGMEGQQNDNILVAPVERCWIHHCTFFAGYCENPVENDKLYGDGACDFKRGQYYTMSYCYYEYCRKSNLIGSSDTSLQYNISFHHNIWYNCEGRIPLLRKANFHFYNNYIYGDLSNGITQLGYVHSLRADSYMFSEGNYYEGCKQISDGKSNSGKMFNNIYLACLKSNTSKMIYINRETAVENSCAYNDIDYSNFDTNPEVFYFDTINKVSDCYLTIPMVAREECLKFSGSYYRTILNQAARDASIQSNKYSISTAVDLCSGAYEASLSSDTGILYTNANKGRFMGQGITFRLSEYAKVNLNATSGTTDADHNVYVVSEFGQIMLHESGSVVLKPGLYYICSASVDKETKVTKLTFERYAN